MANPERWEAYQVSSRAMGLDLKRSQFQNNFGNYVCEPAADFRAGMLVELSANGMIQRSDFGGSGAVPFGVACYNKTSTQYVMVTDEPVTLTLLVASNLAHAGVLAQAGGVAGVRVNSAVGGAGTTYTEGGGSDYTVNYVNGTIVRVGGSTIVSGSTVYVSYQYALTAAELQREGYNFWNQQDDATIQANKMTVITGPAILFTTQYDASDEFNENDAVYSGVNAASLAGLFTTSNASGFVVGRVMQPPTAADPWLGIKFNGIVA